MSLEAFPKSIFVKFRLNCDLPPLPGWPHTSSQTLQSNVSWQRWSFLRRIFYTQGSWSNPTRFWNVILSCGCASLEALQRKSCQDLHQDQGKPTSASVAHQHQLKGGHVLACSHLGLGANIWKSIASMFALAISRRSPKVLSQGRFELQNVVQWLNMNS